MNYVSLKDLIPITVSGLALTGTPTLQTFKYNDIIQNNLQVIDVNALNHLKTAQDVDYGKIIYRFRFNKYYNDWSKKVKYLSSPNQIVEDPNFKSIVEMGTFAVPYIIEHIEKEPSYLVWALNFIYEFKISDNSLTTIPEACKAWLKYLKSAQIA